MTRSFAYIDIGAILLTALCVMFLVANRNPSTTATSNDGYAGEWLAQQHAGLRSGKQSHLYFYESLGTDAMILEFEGEPAIKKLTFELTDLSDAGVKTIASLPNLERLTLYGGRPGVGDPGLQMLRGKDKLVTLKLVNTNITDGGLAILQTLPNLKHLTIYRDGFRDELLTDKAVLELQKLSSLSTLNVAGGWLSRSGLKSLRAMLPNCRVVQDENWEVD